MSAKGNHLNNMASAAAIKRVLVSLAIVVAAALGFSAGNSRHLNALAATEQQPAAATTISAATPTFSYADVVSRVAPAVVTIHSEMRVREAQQSPFQDDPFFQQFFGDRLPRSQEPPREHHASALGSGVIVSPDGYILTNHHVIDGAEHIKVELNDRRTLDAKVVGSDKLSDLAVLKIDASNLPVLSLGDSDRARVGDVVLAIGNPLGVGQTVTSGIVSAKGRQTGLGNGGFEDFIQTDAPINQGNSGGALVNTGGELIGINSQILSRSGGSIGIGFAIPSNMAKSVMEQLIKSGKVRRGQLGIIVQQINSDLAASLNLKDTRGVIVSQVQTGSAAERAGVKQGDVITALNGVAVNDPNTFRNEVAQTQPGAGVTLNVLRGGQEQQLRATLGELAAAKGDAGDQSGANGANTNGDTGKLGVGVEPLTPEIASQLNLPSSTQGVVVGEVDPAGPAADVGLQRGDVIEQVNQQPVRSAADVKAALGRSGSRPTLLLVNHQGSTIYLTIRPRQ